MSRSVALVTNVTQYAGPAAATALAAAGFRTVVHDASFADPSTREGYAATHPNVRAIAAQDATALVSEALKLGDLDAIVSNDFILPGEALFGAFGTEASTLAGFEHVMRELVYKPYELVRAPIPSMTAPPAPRPPRSPSRRRRHSARTTSRSTRSVRTTSRTRRTFRRAAGRQTKPCAPKSPRRSRCSASARSTRWAR